MVLYSHLPTGSGKAGIPEKEQSVTVLQQELSLVRKALAECTHRQIAALAVEKLVLSGNCLTAVFADSSMETVVIPCRKRESISGGIAQCVLQKLYGRDTVDNLLGELLCDMQSGNTIQERKRFD